MRKLPRSVLILGIIGIVWGGLGIAYYTLEICRTLSGDSLGQVILHAMGMFTWLYVTLGLGTVASFLLVPAAINVLHLRPLARWAMLVYCTLMVIQETLRVMIMFFITFPWLMDHAPMVHAHPLKYLVLTALITGAWAIGKLWYPLCVGYFFTRPRVIGSFRGVLPEGVSMFPVLPADQEATQARAGVR